MSRASLNLCFALLFVEVILVETTPVQAARPTKASSQQEAKDRFASLLMGVTPSASPKSGGFMRAMALTQTRTEEKLMDQRFRQIESSARVPGNRFESSMMDMQLRLNRVAWDLEHHRDRRLRYDLFLLRISALRLAAATRPMLTFMTGRVLSFARQYDPNGLEIVAFGGRIRALNYRGPLVRFFTFATLTSLGAIATAAASGATPFTAGLSAGAAVGLGLGTIASGGQMLASYYDVLDNIKSETHPLSPIR